MTKDRVTVRMLTGLSGPHYSVSAGDLHECSTHEATRFIAAGIAEPVDPVAKPAREKAERAVKVAPGEETRGLRDRVKGALRGGTKPTA